MNAHRNEFPIGRMANVLEVSRSGYYAWASRGPSVRAKDQAAFDGEVHAAFLRTKERYGRRRITIELRARGLRVGRKRVERSMRRQGLRARARRKYIVTTDSRHSHAVADNLLARNFTTERPNQVWVSDITYIPSADGWLYLAVFIDLYSRKVVGWCLSHSLKHETVLAAFFQGVRRRGSVIGLIVHSDRGVQYCCNGVVDVMRLTGVVQSMSRKGDCWDNAVAESFFATLKKEMPAGLHFRGIADAEQYLFEYIEVEYNRQRYHSTLDYATPSEYEAAFWNRVMIAEESTSEVA